MVASRRGTEQTTTGLSCLPSVEWGCHAAHLYASREDLLDVLVPFFRQGLDNDEECIWVADDPLSAEDAVAALREVVPDLDARMREGRIEILDRARWYPDDHADLQSVVHRWLAREQDALARGRAGLRISGNAASAYEQWSASYAYESCVHEALHDRRVVAICSYPASRCTPEEALDILRNHHFALVRQGGGWRAVRSAMEMLGAAQGFASSTRSEDVPHLVQFMEQGFDAASVSAFLHEGLARGEAAAAVMPGAKLQALRAELSRRGHDVDALTARGRLRIYFVEDAAARVRTNGAFDGAKAARFVEAFLDEMHEIGPRSRIYGELVDLLAREGDHDGAVALDRLWDEALHRRPLPVLCGYSFASFDGPDGARWFDEVCRCHDEVVHAHEIGPPSALRQQAFLVQRSRALQSATAHLTTLQRITSALLDTRGVDEVAAVVVNHMSEALDAPHAILAVPEHGADTLRIVGRRGAHADAPNPQRVLADAPLPAAVAYRTARPVFLSTRAAIEHAFPAFAEMYRAVQALTCMPLEAAGRRIGVVGFGYGAPRALTAAERALLDDLADQASLALARAQAFDDETRARAEADRRSREAAVAVRVRDDFLAVAGHELRTPLSALALLLESAQRGADAPDVARGRIEKAVRQTERLSKLVDELLDVSRIVQGKLHLERETFDLGELARDLIARHEELARQHGCSLRLVQPASVVGAWDRLRIEQVVSNLLVNAIRYGEKKPVEVSIEADGDRARLVVVDRGIGIARSEQQRIFERFERAVSDRNYGGLGLGLWIARQIVLAHEGTIAVDSEPGRGAAFTIELPRRA